MHVLSLLTLAQMPWTANLPARGVALDILRPKFDGVETSLGSAAFYISGRFRAGGALSLRFEVPFANLEASGNSSTAVGNPYIGLEALKGRMTYDLGFRPSLTPESEFAGQLGIYSDIMRFVAFVPHTANVSGHLTYRSQSASGMTFEAGAGPSVWIPTDGDAVDLILDHFGSVGYRGSKVWTAVGLGGIAVLTSDDGGFDNITFYQLGASVGLNSGSVRPALHLILPLDDAITSDVPYVLGLGVAILTR
jgi:hypothetical protein